jgi:hypothetical protein
MERALRQRHPAEGRWALPVSLLRVRDSSERGAHDICPVCFWEDDGQDDHDADEVRGGPNYSPSLSEARRNFSRIGAVEERVLPHVRPPTDRELPP